jgi:hypothetical protein
MALIFSRLLPKRTAAAQYQREFKFISLGNAMPSARMRLSRLACLPLKCLNVLVRRGEKDVRKTLAKAGAGR